MNKIIKVFCLIIFSAGVANASLNGPLPVLWDTVWTIPTAHRGTIDSYLQKRSSQGFDAVMMGIADWGLRNSPLGNGQLLFNGTVANGVGDVTRPNEGGFQYIDQIIAKAGSLRLTVALLPVATGGPTEYIESLKDRSSGEDRAYRYGLYVGNRYRNIAHLIWILGGDVGGISEYPQIVGLTQNLAKGIRAAGANQPMSFHAGTRDPSDNEGRSAEWFPPDGQFLDFNMVQAKTHFATRVRLDYQLGKPTGLGEGAYDTDRNSPNHDEAIYNFIAGMYSSFLAGAQYWAYGMIFGQNIGSCCGGPYINTDSPGVSYALIAKNLMQSRQWKEYVPDESFVTDFSGEKTAAIRTNSAAMIYLRGADSTVSIDMARLNRYTTIKVSRFNPLAGLSVDLGIFSSSGTRTFDTAGLAHAVLLFDSLAGTIPSPDMISCPAAASDPFTDC